MPILHVQRLARQKARIDHNGPAFPHPAFHRFIYQLVKAPNRLRGAHRQQGLSRIETARLRPFSVGPALAEANAALQRYELQRPTRDHRKSSALAPAFRSAMLQYRRQTHSHLSHCSISQYDGRNPACEPHMRFLNRPPVGKLHGCCHRSRLESQMCAPLYIEAKGMRLQLRDDS